MSDEGKNLRCEPASDNRAQNTFHLLEIGGAMRPSVWVDHYGDGSGTAWLVLGIGSMGATFAHERGYRYLCPIRLPDGTIAKAMP